MYPDPSLFDPRFLTGLSLGVLSGFVLCWLLFVSPLKHRLRAHNDAAEIQRLAAGMGWADEPQSLARRIGSHRRRDTLPRRVLLGVGVLGIAVLAVLVLLGYALVVLAQTGWRAGRRAAFAAALALSPVPPAVPRG